ncbi:hypothetical protein CEXT_621961 [Caerostris extrusa]|uniref:Uncharacterized protein n=1 Tax=Caerostris extrusa TaxID=172846 RepID=A0AAV4NA55_CAEEX|nr:hypothetical protein CEXT_621961 [Caerostris extrusa]
MQSLIIFVTDEWLCVLVKRTFANLGGKIILKSYSSSMSPRVTLRAIYFSLKVTELFSPATKQLNTGAEVHLLLQKPNSRQHKVRNSSLSPGFLPRGAERAGIFLFLFRATQSKNT